MVADSAGPRVLAVDDLQPIRMLIDRILSSSGYQVDVAASVAEARSMNPAGYDVLLVDAFLGDEMGTDLIRELVTADPAAAGRCLLVTGGGMTEALPGVGCLAKPFDPEALVRAVRALRGPDAAGGPDAARRPASGAGPPRSGPPRGHRWPGAQGAPWPARARPSWPRPGSSARPSGPPSATSYMTVPSRNSPAPC